MAGMPMWRPAAKAIVGTLPRPTGADSHENSVDY
jgi:hypothetical protein